MVVPEGSLMQMWVNPTAAPFDDPKVRRALFLAIDRNAACKTVYGEDSGSPGTFFGPGYIEILSELPNVPGYRANKQEDLYEAKNLLAEAGYPDGHKIDLNATNRGSTLRLTEAVTAQLRKDVGIELTLVSTDLPSYY